MNELVCQLEKVMAEYRQLEHDIIVNDDDSKLDRFSELQISIIPELADKIVVEYTK